MKKETIICLIAGLSISGIVDSMPLIIVSGAIFALRGTEITDAFITVVREFPEAAIKCFQK